MGEAGGADLSGVWKRYSRRGPWVLRDVDLRVRAGTVHVLVGGNGDGKSTLLRIVAGVSVASRGRISRPGRSVAYVPERLPVDVRMNAGTYLAHMARIRGRGHAGILARSTELLERFGFRPGPQVPMRQLSRGNRQKVALAQALGAAARLTVLDEPFSGLDQDAAGQLRSLLDGFCDDGRSVLISAHRAGPVDAGAVVHRLAGGRVGPYAGTARPPSSPTRLVLRGSGGQAADPHDPAVLRVHPGSGPDEVVVLTTDPDRVLRTALGQGWSFVQGGPHPGGTP